MSRGHRDDWDVGLAELLKVLLDKGTTITADIPITAGDIEVLSLKIQPLLLASFETAKKVGLEIPTSVKKKEGKDV
ncbi:MAG: gas vesicle protein GvpJ [Candidatus Aerophobetes bacterium]|nr:gas vesicle protein GvpJ [Candidatus Aerophobetes bacterium]